MPRQARREKGTVQKVCKCTKTTEIQVIEIEQRNKHIKVEGEGFFNKTN